MIIFYKPLKWQINVYPSVFLRKIPLTGKHLSLLENPLGGFPCRSCRSKSGAIACASQLQAKKRELKLSSHIIGLTIVRSQNQLKQVEPTYAISFVVYFNNIISLKQQIVKPFQKKDFLQVLLEL